MHLSFLQLSTLLGLAGLAVAIPFSPFGKRGNFDIGKTSSTPPKKGNGDAQFGKFKDFNPQVNDEVVLQFALMLEIAQTLFYQQAVSQFSESDMINAGLSSSEVIQIQNSVIVENTHVTTLVSTLQTLGQAPLNQPQFFFQFNSVADFITQLSVNEVVATGAYLGAAPLISSKDILGAAGSILAVEARQSSFVNLLLGINAFSNFESPLSIEQVISLVAPSISSIPSGTVLDALGLDTSAFALPTIDIKVFAQVSINSMLNFQYSNGQQITPPSGQNQLFCSFTSGTSASYSQYTPGQGCMVPSSLSIGVMVFIEIVVSQDTNFSSRNSAGQFVMVVKG